MDSDTPVWPSSLPLPLQAGRPQESPRSDTTLMESGRLRKRRVHEQSLKTIEVNWNFTEDQFQNFQTFFATDLANGSLSFAIELFGVEEEAAFLAPYSFAHTDNLFAVSATLEIIPEA